MWKSHFRCGLGLLIFSFIFSISAADDGEGIYFPPQPDPELFASLKKASPFQRTLNVADTYSLRAVAMSEDVAYARVYNRHTEKTITIELGGEPQYGLELIKIMAPRDKTNLGGVAARISFAGEEAELRYDSVQIDPNARGGTGGKGRGGGGKGGPDGKRKGPTPEERAKYNALSGDQKKKFHEYIKAVVKKYPDMPREERGNLIRGAMQKLNDGRDIDVPK